MANIGEFVQTLLHIFVVGSQFDKLPQVVGRLFQEAQIMSQRTGPVEGRPFPVLLGTGGQEGKAGGPPPI